MATKTKNARAGAKFDGRMVRSSNDLPEEARKEVVMLCNEALANLFDLFSQTKQAHWNVKGPQFYMLHELYDELAAQLLGHIDTVAERATALGGAATGTVRMAADASSLPEFSDGPIGSRESVEALCERYAAAAKLVRESIDKAEEQEDMDTADVFTEVSRDLDKDLWFLEAHIQQTS